jgi:ferric-dicitrate binding protein FerR (iron transport regulator)
MQSKEIYSTLLRYVKNKYSYEDYLKVKQWINGSRTNKELENAFRFHWQQINDENYDTDPSLDHILDNVMINIKQQETRKIQPVWNFYRKVAAILLLPLLASALWLGLSRDSITHEPESWVEVYAPEGSRIKFTLPDGSMGWLNSGARMKYPAIFGKNRNLELSGEAFFEVKHLEESDFTVNVAEMNGRDFGTKFNIAAYPEES